ncbi:MAG: class I SAM-dependent methyltransferase [Alphaproteobacteria bacterium]|nr:MAG: class I SAM-dependent methyltransferase [Alphaproteobacteria bacterium]
MNSLVASVSCPINGLPARIYCRKGGAAYYLEPTSGTIFQARMPSVGAMNAYADDEYASGVYREYAKSRDLKIATARPRLAAIKERTQGRRLLDVGCATGFFMEAAADDGFDVRGVEFSTVAISLARPDIRARIVRGDVNTLLARETEKFDVVTAFDIIEHVQNPEQFLRDIREILKPGGVIAISSPDTDHVLRYLMRSKWPMLQPMQHTMLFSRRSIATLLERCGFADGQVEATHKVLTMDYLADQLAATNPGLNRAYQALSWMVPAALKRRSLAINIGEFVAYARRA